MAKKAEPEPSSKQFKGVYRNKGYWRARIWDVDKEHYLGHFADPNAAASAYDRACICLRGQATAVREGLNMPESKYKRDMEALEARNFEDLVGESRASGAQSSGQTKLK